MSRTAGRGRISSAIAQDIGGVADAVLRESVRSGALRTPTGERVHLAVLAQAPESSADAAWAEAAVERVFQFVEQSATRDLSATLRRGLEIALGDSAVDRLDRSGPAIGAAVIARQRAFSAQAGGVLGIRISRGEASRLSGTHGMGHETPPIQVTPASGISLRRGDRVLLLSDGILGRAAATGQPFISAAEIAQHVSELAPLEAARHLISLALGRDVDRNVSVAVLALPGGAQPSKRSRIALVASVAALIVLLGTLAAVVLLRRPTEQTLTDFGFAVLVEGGVAADQGGGNLESVNTLGTLSSDSLVSAATDARLILQTTFDGEADLANGNLYLEQSALVRLDSIDAQPSDGGVLEGPGATELELLGGRLLVLRTGGTREYRVVNGPFTASLIGAGRGAMGIELDQSRIILNCIVGTCRVQAPDVGDSLLQGGEQVIARPPLPPERSAILQSDLDLWDRICRGCLSSQ